METVVIAGVGLIGGSFGLSLKAAGFRGRVIGIGRPETIAKALAKGAIDEGGQDLIQAAAQADLIYLAHSVTRILADIQALSGHLRPGALITDAGSTKVEIMRQARQYLPAGTFLGGHPMAGKAERGVENAESNLFLDAPYFLCHQLESQPESSSVSEFTQWVRKIGANPVNITAEEHDPLLARISHLPQLISTALAATLSGLMTSEQAEATAGPGLRSMLRLAGSTYEDIWEDILKTNPAEIEKALDAYLAVLTSIRAQLGSPELEKQFLVAKNFAPSLRNPIK